MDRFVDVQSISSGRRQFLRVLAGLGLVHGAMGALRIDASDLLPNPIGYATIAWPQKEFAHALDTISHLGFRGVQMLGWVREAYAGAKTQELKQQLASLKLKPVALSCSAARLAPGQHGNETVEVRGYAEFFSRLGGTFLQVTDGGNPTKRVFRRGHKNLSARA